MSEHSVHSTDPFELGHRKTCLVQIEGLSLEMKVLIFVLLLHQTYNVGTYQNWLRQAVQTRAVNKQCLLDIPQKDHLPQLTIMSIHNMYFGGRNKKNITEITLQPLYNTVPYNTILDITQFKDGFQKCIDYIEKWP